MSDVGQDYRIARGTTPSLPEMTPSHPEMKEICNADD